MDLMVLQERARWLNLINLSTRDKEDLLNTPVVTQGLFGTAIASMQKRCENKKSEDEALPHIPSGESAPLRGGESMTAPQALPGVAPRGSHYTSGEFISQPPAIVPPQFKGITYSQAEGKYFTGRDPLSKP